MFAMIGYLHSKQNKMKTSNTNIILEDSLFLGEKKPREITQDLKKFSEDPGNGEAPSDTHTSQ